MKRDGKGSRFNDEKTRFDLIPEFANEQFAKVLTYGARKYSDNNWKRGMPFTVILASLERHLQAFKRGEDYDPETGLLHTAHIMCNSAFLTEYYKIYPQGDDRQHSYLENKRIALDIDDVLSDFIGPFCKRFGIDKLPTSWNFCEMTYDRLVQLKDDKEFWENLPVKTNPEDIPFEPCCYITSRNIPVEWTRNWLKKNGFPIVPIHTVGIDKTKVEIAKEAKVDIFVDDKFQNFVELNNAGIFCYLFDASHNKRYNVGHKRVYDLNGFTT